MTEDLLAGVTPRTAKAELIRRLEQANKALKKASGSAKRKTKTVDVVADARTKWATVPHEPLYQVLVLGTKTEVETAVEFLTDLENVLPQFLQRVHAGAKKVVEGG